MKLEKKSPNETLGERLKQFITDICETIGPRLGTSDAERKAGERIRKEYERYCDETFAEEFSCHPAAFLDSVRVTSILYVVGVILYLWFPILTAIFGILGLAIFFAQIMFLKEIIDPIFPKRTGVNIYGKIHPEKQPTQVVLVSGHHDSAYEFPIVSWLGSRTATLVLIAVGLAVITITLSIFRTLSIFLFPQVLWFFNWLLIIPLISLIPLLVFGFRLRSGTVVLGANDNLSGVATTLGVGDWVKDHKLQTTEVWLVSFACEENMRGSMRFVQRHKEELQNAYLLNFDMVGLGDLQIITAEPFFRTTMTSELCTMVAEAGKTADLEIPLEVLPFAGTDASNFINAGLKATSVGAIMSSDAPTHWHTVEDTPDKIDPQTLLQAVQLAVSFLQYVDAK
ncbi:MAG: M28 family metallopeptidase [Candidatus Hermodarchaeota archaeon]